ncbi:MAG: hypothetical protein CND43_00940 [Flavobacteriales bacterium MED-G15]|nr:MAG: hypothetical protein CND43_00940 [Flavobacteriales bacterium MED-G15]|tara:strand:- start:411 stop:977 length:567 start_codon:yes stop_codon:yes gene_type:complete
MSRLKYIILIAALFISCKNKTEVKQNDIEKVNDALSIATPNNAVKLTQFTPQFMEENKINEWKNFKQFKEAIEDLSKLNPKGIIIFLSELYKITKQMLQAPFPETFNGLPVYSRIKVVQTQIIKCHFHASNNQSEKLNVALDELYLEYNILLRRMISFAEERQISLDSVGFDLPAIQDSKTNPAFSKN